MKKLSGYQVKQLCDALKESFDREELQRFLRFNFEKNLDDITKPSDYRHTVFQVVEHFNHENRAFDLLDQALEQKPHKSELINLAKQIKDVRRKIRSMIPDLLPYLPDRSIQRFQLGQAVSSLEKEVRKPLVCIIHGGDDQCHDMFFQCLKDVCIPEILSLDEGIAPKDYFISWPGDVVNFNDHLLMKLSGKILNRGTASFIEIANHLSGFPCPVLLHSYLLTDTLKKQGEEVFQQFIQFWDQWPERMMTHQIIIFLFVQYQDKTGFFEGRKYRQINKNIERILEDIQPNTFDSISFVALPKLEDVSQYEVEDWARNLQTKKLCKLDDLLDEVKSFFADWEKQHSSNVIPMSKLSERLYEFLTIHFNPEEEHV